MSLELTKYIFLFLIGTSVLNFAIALLLRVKTKSKELNYLVLYWPCLILTYFAVALLSGSVKEIGTSYFFQIFASNLLVVIMCRSQGIKMAWPMYISFQLAAMTTAAYLLYFTEASFTAAVLPVSLSFSLPFIKPIWHSLVSNRKNSNYLEKTIGVVFITAIINHINFAFFRLDPNAAWWGWSVSIAQYQSLSLFLPLLINHRREEKEIAQLNQAIEKISGKDNIGETKLDSLYANLDFQISQKEQFYRLLQETNKNLEAERETNEILIRTISHDLANPLTVISAYSEMLQAEKFSTKEETDKIWARMKLNINSALSMMQRIRGAILNRTQASLVKVEPVSLTRCLIRLEELFDTRLSEKNIALEIKNSLSSQAQVMAEEEGLTEHVLANILSNAIKYSYKDGKIVLTVTEDRESVTINIRDFGVGIKQKTGATPLYASSEGTEGESGTGFGLMVTGYFVRKFNGELHISSEASTPGTLVTLKLQKSFAKKSLPQNLGEITV